MNILFICNEYPPGKSGGIGSSTRTLARGLQAAGHAVFVAGSLFDLNTVWLGIIILTLMATLLSWIVQLAENRIISWKTKR